MKLQPLFARVLLERVRAQQVGSIIIPDSVAERHASLKCRVLDAGPTCEPEIRDLIGKHVLIGKNAGTWLSAEGNAVPKADEAVFFMVQEQDILCAVDDEQRAAA
ncbi:MAG: co-chaperone GroES family protein [Geminicoccaceae bacterium]